MRMYKINYKTTANDETHTAYFSLYDEAIHFKQYLDDEPCVNYVKLHKVTYRVVEE